MKLLSNRGLHLVLSVAVAASACIATNAQATFAPATSGPASYAQPSASGEVAFLPDASTALPDAPSFSSNSAAASQNTAEASVDATITAGQGSPLPESSHTQKYVEPNQSVPVLTPGDKILLGLRDAVSPFAAAGWISSAGYEQLINGSPNYGTDRGAFGQRLGAAVIRDLSESVLSDSVMSSVLREDPRYYRLGNSHRFFPRVIYAATRTVISRTDSGRPTANFSLIAGNLGGAALTNLYYPQSNRGPVETLETFRGSMIGSVIGYVVAEFYPDLIHPHHSQP